LAFDSGPTVQAAPVLASFVAGASVQGAGLGTALFDPVSGVEIARVSSAGLDLAEGFRYARSVGGPALRALSFSERAAALGRIADVLAGSKDRWFLIARSNSGNTRTDAAIDIDGAIGTLKYFAKIGAELGAATYLRDGDPIRLARDPNFQGLHIGVPLEGVAVHINAFNFPAWGLWEKAAVALLAGVPVIAKPATLTSLLSAEMVAAVINAQILPDGCLSIIAGPAGDLLEHVRPGDAIAFTGSADTAEQIRAHPRVRAAGVRLNVEADSLNAAVLGPGATPGSPAFEAFVREVAREMTTKAGQKCTAIRRVIVPEELGDATGTAIASVLAATVVGDPSDDKVTMGPLVSQSQRDAADSGLARLAECTTIVYQTPAGPAGRFVSPTLLRALDNSAPLIHELEIFGPVATILTYRDAAEAFALARRGAGSLVVSIFSEDAMFLTDAARQLAPSHGRVMLVDATVATTHTGHGIVLPSLIHGGPGRAGGGEELGGLRGLSFYSQWSAVQGPAAVLTALAAGAAMVHP
jgi:3,4-dehydroadipyl-CoA semialdehyde dehydrogenase